MTTPAELIGITKRFGSTDALAFTLLFLVLATIACRRDEGKVYG